MEAVIVSSPQPPNPATVAAAQSADNQQTAETQSALNMVNSVNPWGSVNYNQTGTTSYVDGNGKTVSVPQFTQTTTYDPQHQQIFDASTQAQQNIANIASDQTAKVGKILDDPFTYNPANDATAWAYKLGSQTILPQQQQQTAALQAQLINEGIRPGTQAYTNEMQRMTNANSQQLDQLALQGNQQAFSEALQQRQEPLNEISALLSGSQLANPATQSSATPQSQVAGVDYSGLVENNYNQQVAQSNAALGGLFGLAGSAVSGATHFIPGFQSSDERLKTDIRKVGELDNGMPVYLYRFKAGGPFQIGLMAQEVAKVKPEAVGTMPNGYLGVDYAKAVA
jgi:hypothetical protein